jgi:hypothetical protein
MKEIKKIFINATESYPIQSGFLLLGLGIIFLLFQLDKKNTFKMKDYSSSEWRMLFYSWTLIFIIVLTGVVLIFKYI